MLAKLLRPNEVKFSSTSTVLKTVTPSLVKPEGAVRRQDNHISILSDDIVRLRYVLINGQLRKMPLVVKMRGGPHSIDL